MKKYIFLLMSIVTWCVHIVGMENSDSEMLSELRKVHQRAVEHDELMRTNGLESAFDKKETQLSVLLARAEEYSKQEQKWEKNELSLRGVPKDYRNKSELEFLWNMKNK